MTNETTALAVREVSLSTWETIKAIAPTMRTSGLFKVPNEAAAAAIMLKGYELGLSLTAAFEFIHHIDGPSISPRGALALIYNSPLNGGVEITDIVNDKGESVACEVTMKRKGGIAYTARYTIADAERAGLMKGNSGWAKYPANMLRWRAVGYAADVVFPDVIGGMKRADELGADLTPQGDVIEGSWAVAPASQPAARKPDTAAQNQLAALINEHGVTAIMAANNGVLPTSVDDIDAVSRYMAAQSVPMTQKEWDALQPLPH